MHQADSRPPLPEVKVVEEETFSGHDRIVASGVDDYIARYREAGWLRVGAPTPEVSLPHCVSLIPLAASI